MNHTVNNSTEPMVGHGNAHVKAFSWRATAVFIAMVAYWILQAGVLPAEAGLGSALAAGSALYLLTVFLFYGIPYLVYERGFVITSLLALATAAATSLFFAIGDTRMYFLSVILILAPGISAGMLMRTRGTKPLQAYLVGLALTAFIAAALYANHWPEITQTTSAGVDSLLEDSRRDLLSSGVGADSVDKSIAAVRQTVSILLRLIPALTLLSVVMQFSLGFILFLYLLDKNNAGDKRLAPFLLWKMPFWCMPAAIMILLARLLGSEMMQLWADNAVAFAAVFYSVTGLALMEFYLRKLRFSRLMKTLFYIMLFFSQLIGFLAAVLLGFIDSFTDWRKTSQLYPDAK